MATEPDSIPWGYDFATAPTDDGAGFVGSLVAECEGKLPVSTVWFDPDPIACVHAGYTQVLHALQRFGIEEWPKVKERRLAINKPVREVERVDI